MKILDFYLSHSAPFPAQSFYYRDVNNVFPISAMHSPNQLLTNIMWCFSGDPESKTKLDCKKCVSPNPFFFSFNPIKPPPIHPDRILQNSKPKMLLSCVVVAEAFRMERGMEEWRDIILFNLIPLHSPTLPNLKNALCKIHVFYVLTCCFCLQQDPFSSEIVVVRAGGAKVASDEIKEMAIGSEDEQPTWSLICVHLLLNNFPCLWCRSFGGGRHDIFMYARSENEIVRFSTTVEGWWDGVIKILAGTRGAAAESGNSIKESNRIRASEQGRICLVMAKTFVALLPNTDRKSLMVEETREINCI